jgi:hypothetical protein
VIREDKRAQVSFLDKDDEQKNDRISAVFDNIRKKYGTTSIMFGTAVTGEYQLEFEILDE